jgi:hypothetical protein
MEPPIPIKIVHNIGGGNVFSAKNWRNINKYSSLTEVNLNKYRSPSTVS